MKNKKSIISFCVKLNIADILFDGTRTETFSSGYDGEKSVIIKLDKLKSWAHDIYWQYKDSGINTAELALQLSNNQWDDSEYITCHVNKHLDDIGGIDNLTNWLEIKVAKFNQLINAANRINENF